MPDEVIIVVDNTAETAVVTIPEQTAPVLTIVQELLVTGPPGPPGDLSQLVTSETPAGLLNGANAIFTTIFSFVPESVEVFINGLKIKKIDEFNTSGTNTITLTFSPASTETISVNYKKA